MKVTIEYSRITRSYFFFPDAKDRGVAIVSTRKNEITRVAREHGATEIVFRKRSTVRDLMKFGHFDSDEAQRMARDYYGGHS